ncbi:MAG: hypothetical protein ACRD6X_15595 [Pyrinomonadaceae bacterium]
MKRRTTELTLGETVTTKAKVANDPCLEKKAASRAVPSNDFGATVFV